ncbi:hypothetical protein TKK_0016629 [Trichogramma kaykai]
MAYFPDNAISHFTTHLPKEIRLSGDDWFVGLVEIHLPNTIEHVSDAEAAYSFDNSRDNVLHRFKSGNFNSIEDLINSINDSPDFSEHLEIAPSLIRSGYYSARMLVAYIETLLNYNDDAKKSHLTSTLWYVDQSGRFEAAPEVRNADRANMGLIQRQSYTLNSAPLDMIGHLHCDVFNQDEMLINGVEMRYGKKQRCVLLNGFDGKWEI